MMNNHNVSEIKDQDSYGEHLFCLDHRFISFFTDQLQETPKLLKTQASSSDKSISRKASQTFKLKLPWKDDQFQLSFMKEHQFILQKYIRNHKELLFATETETINSDPLNDTQTESSTLQEHLSLLHSQPPFLSQAKLARIHQEILAKDRIVEFLSFITEEYSQSISLPLLKIACLILQQCLRKINEKLGEREIIEYVNKIIARSLLKQINQLLPKPLKVEELSILKTFVNVFAQTLLFVNHQFFVNPYYQLEEELIVREFQNYQLFLYDSYVGNEESDDEEYEEKKGRKLIKQ